MKEKSALEGTSGFGFIAHAELNSAVASAIAEESARYEKVIVQLQKQNVDATSQLTPLKASVAGCEEDLFRSRKRLEEIARMSRAMGKQVFKAREEDIKLKKANAERAAGSDASSVEHPASRERPESLSSTDDGAQRTNQAEAPGKAAKALPPRERVFVDPLSKTAGASPGTVEVTAEVAPTGDAAKPGSATSSAPPSSVAPADDSSSTDVSPPANVHPLEAAKAATWDDVIAFLRELLSLPEMAHAGDPGAVEKAIRQAEAEAREQMQTAISRAEAACLRTEELDRALKSARAAMQEIVSQGLYFPPSLSSG
jgi:hypothetical protein